MSYCKHTYTDDCFPTNTGSLERPARFNLRLTCQTRARTHAVFSGFREAFRLPETTSYADIFESKMLPTLEHVLRKIRHGDQATRTFFARLSDPLPKEDYLRTVYQRLKARFEPAQKPAKRKA